MASQRTHSVCLGSIKQEELDVAIVLFAPQPALDVGNVGFLPGELLALDFEPFAIVSCTKISGAQP